MRWFSEPLRTRAGHVEVVFQTHTKLTRHTQHRLIRKTHAHIQRCLVALDQIRPFMDVHADAVTGAVGQSWGLVFRTKSL